MRKNSFGSMCIFGVDKKCEVEGIWVWKGDELAFTVSRLNIVPPQPSAGCS